MNTSRTTPIATLVAVGVLLAGLVGCRALPLPIEIDLLAELAEARSGVVEETVRAGVNPHLLMEIPEQEDNCIDLDQLPVSVVYAQLTYAVDVNYEGPDLSGLIEIQPYLASSRAELWTEASALGDWLRVDLASTHVTLDGVAELEPAQVAALNEGQLCWGLRLRGTDVAAAADGTISASYEVQKLVARAGVAVF